ncbi:MAG: hypothetical protein O9282_04985 [Flavobacterium sp.]|uniref:DUF4440 domain-containing protein n=1 Tax=Flavobacterium sp. TaxID=239 RepID=UPI0022BE45D1|nr:DUF4440 domain-containing protein [Flavobacterium sp.]MCZ8330647.1 hypothetical protein [Flavobacterium sp.]
METNKMINKLELLWNTYLETTNINGLEELIDDDFIFFDENGSLNKKEFIDEYNFLNQIVSLNNVKEIVINESKNMIYSSVLIEVTQRLFNQQTKQIIRYTKIWQTKKTEFKVVLLQTTKMNVYYNNN